MTAQLSAYLYADEAERLEALVDELPWAPDRSEAVKDRAADLVRRVRAEKRPAGQLESFLQQYSLTTEEGLALMCLAEALLRIPDRATGVDLIRDKVLAANWRGKVGGTYDWVVRTAGFGLLVTRHTLDSAIARVGEPFIREAMMKAMRIMGQQFVLGRDIEEAMQRAQPLHKKGYAFSYDILGEGARTAIDAEKYYNSYVHAINYIGERIQSAPAGMSSISVKLSALHPRYSFAQKERCVPEMQERLVALCRLAANYNLPLTVDAEEVDRLELSLEIMEAALQDRQVSGWEGFGLAVQAYQKRCLPLIDRLKELSQTYQRRLRVRLVKGAYWDTEVKRCQVMGLPDYPVYTRKVNTDVSYLAGAHKLLNNTRHFYPMLATHNAHTVAAVCEMADEARADFEFQRLHGMGESLYNIVLKEALGKVSVYAPVGPHEDLLAYLVRRLLENGANTSFVNRLLDPAEPVENLVGDPVEKALERTNKRHSQIVLPKDIYKGEAPMGRRNSAGMDLTDPPSVTAMYENFQRFEKPYEAMPLIGGKLYRDTTAEAVKNPADYTDNLGTVYFGNKGLADKAMRVAKEGFPAWSRTNADTRAKALERFADLMEKHRDELMSICVREAGKTIPDAIAEIREAVDFCRYYANRGREDFSDKGHALPGPTGESNAIKLIGRGVFVCISPWNFPLAIFTGQIVAALMAGNSVVAKPAEQTPLIAMRAVQLMHEAGIPEEALNLLPGDGFVGAALVEHPDVAGVAFTGSTAVAWEINKTLAAKKGPIVPLIAETGGLNAMIVDSSALPEQVVDDAVLSAFGSAGQRCSALRLLCLQDDIADKVIRMLQGAMQELQVGNPMNLSTDIGPVIDDEARGHLVHHREALHGFGKMVYEVPLETGLSEQGHFFAPCAFELDDLTGLDKEVFGPVMHIVRFKKNKLEDLIDDLNAKGYGLTFGVHSRLDGMQEMLAEKIRAGNVYINRSMIGAVVGTQPFGGMGLSGTGPKAGGPHYLARFATEKVVSVNTTAAGGNTSLVSLED